MLSRTRFAVGSHSLHLDFAPQWGTLVDNVFFFGVTDTDPFDRVSIIEANDYDGILLDDLTVGYVAPEPSSIAILAAGGLAMALGLGVRRCKAQRKGIERTT